MENRGINTLNINVMEEEMKKLTEINILRTMKNNHREGLV